MRSRAAGSASTIRWTRTPVARATTTAVTTPRCFVEQQDEPATGRSDPGSFDGLAGDRGDEVEVLVDVQDGESGEFGGCCDEEVGDRWGAVLAAVGAESLDLDRSSFDRGCEVLDGHR
jgi:hypothetical protein